MKILDVTSLPIPDVKVVRFGRFLDERGYFSEPFRRGDVDGHEATGFLRGVQLPQTNESYSRPRVIRGLHFQWNPYMGKLVRTISGRMVDLALDIRLGSPTFGNVVAHDMPASPASEWSEWIWVPPGFAHGNFFTEETVIEYLCSGEYSPGNEAGVSPLAEDLDWSLVPEAIASEFADLVRGGATISEKDREAPSLEAWERDERSRNFVFSELRGEAA